MPSITPIRDYEKLADAELKAAARSASISERKTHLDQAGIYAALGEHTRAYSASSR